MNDSKETGSYDIGRGKPPREHQWPKGTSGNPAGRPKKCPELSMTGTGSSARMIPQPDVDRIILRAARRRVRVSIGGRLVSMKYVEALVEILFQKAREGNVRAIIAALRLLEKAETGQAIA